MPDDSPISRFMETHFKHFNAAALVDAARAYRDHVDAGGKMLVAIAGAMSTAELGISLAEMIRRDKVHFVSCTGANLEEDLFNLVAHEHYERVPDYRDLTPGQEKELLDRGMNRVTDTCIPEEEAMRVLDKAVLDRWMAADRAGERKLPHEFVYEIIRDGVLVDHYQIDAEDSWVVAAAEKDLPMVVPGWEDSTLGNSFVAEVWRGKVEDVRTVKSGLEYMRLLVEWYFENSGGKGVGFFQIGGGIAGDFPICAVPLINQDINFPVKDPEQMVPCWSYFCQISDSTTSYGSYSGAVPNEKITWGKLDPDTPRFIVESDATIVAPLMFAHVLGW
ncbi:MAG: deoxyhypusine synthase family protein [Planctomycetota bacterium]|jgi:deoxyhypusine synthase